MSLFSLRTNLSALGTSRNFTAHYVSLADSVRRLSTGLRVERAADDAAGLAIRELMRADVASLHQGARNVDDAISLIQTADGALSVIDERLIRMKELAEQAATGTYDSTQRLMIDSEFQQMASEIERIARATDFNGIHLLDGSLSGPHDGSQMEATGALKIHFGTGNDSAEDYYYIQIGDATLAGLGLMDGAANAGNAGAAGGTGGAGGGRDGDIHEIGFQIPDLFDDPTTSVLKDKGTWQGIPGFTTRRPQDIQNWVDQQGTWYFPGSTMFPNKNPTFVIPKGTKNFVLVSYGGNGLADNDIELFAIKPTKTENHIKYAQVVHLAGTELTTDAASIAMLLPGDTYVNDTFDQCWLNGQKIDTSAYDDSYLNTGPSKYDPA